MKRDCMVRSLFGIQIWFNIRELVWGLEPFHTEKKDSLDPIFFQKDKFKKVHLT